MKLEMIVLFITLFSSFCFSQVNISGTPEDSFKLYYDVLDPLSKTTRSAVESDDVNKLNFMRFKFSDGAEMDTTILKADWNRADNSVDTIVCQHVNGAMVYNSGNCTHRRLRIKDGKILWSALDNFNKPIPGTKVEEVTISKTPQVAENELREKANTLTNHRDLLGNDSYYNPLYQLRQIGSFHGVIAPASDSNCTYMNNASIQKVWPKKGGYSCAPMNICSAWVHCNNDLKLGDTTFTSDQLISVRCLVPPGVNRCPSDPMKCLEDNAIEEQLDYYSKNNYKVDFATPAPIRQR